MNQNNEPIRDASVLGIPKMLLLGLQHMFAMFGATILVPILKQLFWGGCPACSGHPDLRRYRHTVFPFLHQI